MVILFVDEMVKGPDLFGSHALGVGAEFDVDGTAFSDGVGFGGCRKGRVLIDHALRGTGADAHLVATALLVRSI